MTSNSTEQRVPLLTAKPALIPAIIGAAFLLLALLPLPGWYYELLRWENGYVAIVVVILAFRSEAKWLAAAGVALMIMWNPIWPFYLDRAVWFFIDIAGAALYLVIGWNVPAAKAQGGTNKAGEWVDKEPWPWWRWSLIILGVIVTYWVVMFVLTGGFAVGGVGDCPNWENDGRGAYCAG